MFELEPFSQDEMLRTFPDPEVRGGVCVALCDHWLADVLLHPDRQPALRLDRLKVRFHEVAQDHKAYGKRRAQVGPTTARRESGARHGIDYEEQTTISRAYLDMGAIRRKLAGDLARLGAAATWSLRFRQGGHAIAGFHGLAAVTSNIHRARMHLFDPNVGEYTCELRELDGVLEDLLNRFPLYREMREIRRTTVA